MEECWNDVGPYNLAKLADRVVPVPRDNGAPFSLYALCRAWVRNNPAAPLTADGPLPSQRDPKEAASRLGVGPSSSSNGDGLAMQQQQQQQPEAAGEQEQQQGGLLSILPAPLPPTSLETDTSAPCYPWDDFEAREQEEALRKFKDHWIAVRQYHQAVRHARRSRHRQRLQVLFGEESLLQPQSPAAAPAPPLALALQQQHQHPHPQQALQDQQLPLLQSLSQLPQQQQQALLASMAIPMQDAMSLASGTAPSLAQQVGLGTFPGPLMTLPCLMPPGGQPQGLLPGGSGTDPRDGQLVGMAGPHGGPHGPVSAADAQAALAAIMSLGQLQPPGDESTLQQQHQPQLQQLHYQLPQLQQHQHQHQPAGEGGGEQQLQPQQLGLPLLTSLPPQPQLAPAGHSSAVGLLQSMDAVLALHPQQQPQHPQLGHLSEAMVGAAADQAPTAATGDAVGALASSSLAGEVPGTQPVVAVAGDVGSGVGRGGVDSMEVDTGAPNGT